MSYDPANGAAWTANCSAKLTSPEVQLRCRSWHSFPVLSRSRRQWRDRRYRQRAVVLHTHLDGGCKQLTFAVTGMFTADPGGTLEPITVNLINKKSTQY